MEEGWISVIDLARRRAIRSRSSAGSFDFSQTIGDRIQRGA
jgi:hypothetical protein